MPPVDERMPATVGVQPHAGVLRPLLSVLPIRRGAKITPDALAARRGCNHVDVSNAVEVFRPDISSVGRHFLVACHFFTGISFAPASTVLY